MSGPRHPGTEGNDLRPADIKFPDPDGGDGRLSLVNDVAAEFSGLAISNTQPGDMPDGGVWVNLSAEPTGIDRIQTYDESSDAFIPISANDTVVSEEEPEPEIGLLWFEPVEAGANLYASSSNNWEFLQFIVAIPDSGLEHEYDARELSSVSTFTDQVATNDLSESGDPILESDGINGQQTVLYDGEEDIHIGDSATVGSGGEYTFGLVVNPESTSGDNNLILNGSSSAGYRIQITDGDWQVIHEGEGSTSASGNPTTDPLVVVGSHDGSTVYVDHDKTEVINESLAFSSPSDDDLVLGGRQSDRFAHAHIGHAAVYSEYYDSTERDELADALADSWGISI